MATNGPQGLSDHSRAMLIDAAGVAIILLGVGSALLPAADRLKGSAIDRRPASRLRSGRAFRRQSATLGPTSMPWPRAG